jgi:RNA recognition motif-containing protein
MGYGFVETDSEAAAKTALKQLQVRLCDRCCFVG